MNEVASFASTRPIIPAGTQLNGIYEIDEPIAAGGMGEIYKGHAIQTGDVVAIKLIRSDLAEAEAAFAMFRKEASALHNLYHEAIVRYYVFTFDPVLERPYLAMEYVDGQSLSSKLRAGPLAFEAVVRLMHRIAAGLHAAHERGIVHRDVSPDNIIIPGGDMGRAKIIDFGIARSTRLEDEGTVIGAGFAGKYNYVAPEQLGLFGGQITPKSDIYSLGLVLAEALRGGPIDMGGNHVEVIEKRRAVPDLAGVDERLRPLIEQMLQPNPADRPDSMAEVAAWRADAPLRRPPPPRADRAPAAKPAPRGLTLSPAALIACGVVALGLLGLGLVLMPRRAGPPAPPSPVLQNETGGSAGDASGPGLAPMSLPRLDASHPSAAPRAVADAERDLRLAGLGKAIAAFDGGDCAFAIPVVLANNAAAIEGYGLSTAPFRSLDSAVRAADGREPDIGVRTVAEAQCPAIAFLGLLQKAAAAPLKLQLAEAGLRAGQTLKGSVSGADGRDIQIVIVGDDGLVRAVPASRDGAFTARPGAELANGKLQLVIAVAAPKPLASLSPTQPVAAAKAFPLALAEAAKGGAALAAAAAAFRLDP